LSFLQHLHRSQFFLSLHAIDLDLAEQVRAARCQVGECGGPLHRAAYERKPRGDDGVELPAVCRVRLSLCCGWCRHRSQPPSCLFLGRRVYWGAVVLLATAARQGGRQTVAELRQRFGVSRRTVRRWMRYFAAEFPRCAAWLRVRGQVSPTVHDAGLPRNLVLWFQRRSRGQPSLVACLRLLAARYFELEVHAS
jgi:hypothetical protein